MENEIRYVEDSLPEHWQSVRFWVAFPDGPPSERVGIFEAGSLKPWCPELGIRFYSRGDGIPSPGGAGVYAWQPLPAAPPLEKPAGSQRKGEAGAKPETPDARRPNTWPPDPPGYIPFEHLLREEPEHAHAGEIEPAVSDDFEVAKRALRCSKPTPEPEGVWMACRRTSRPREEWCDLCRAAEAEAPRFGDRLRAEVADAAQRRIDDHTSAALMALADALDKDRDELAEEHAQNLAAARRERDAMRSEAESLYIRAEALERENRGKLQEIVELQAELETFDQELIEREHQLSLARGCVAALSASHADALRGLGEARQERDAAREEAQRLSSDLKRSRRSHGETENARVLLLAEQRRLLSDLVAARRSRDEARRLLEDQTSILSKDVADAALVAQNRTLLERVVALEGMVEGFSKAFALAEQTLDAARSSLERDGCFPTSEAER